MDERHCNMWNTCRERMEDGEKACRSCPAPRTVKTGNQDCFGEVAAPVWSYPSAFC